MSTSVVILMPVVLLAIVGLFCFVGCVIPEYTYVPDFTEYTRKTVKGNQAVIAYWPLGEEQDSDPAAELIKGNTGKYIDPDTAKELYPWPEFPIKNPPGPDVLSAAAFGKIAFKQPGLVKGDAVSPEDAKVITPCVVVNGCYVEVPWNMEFVPQASFTVEAWVRVDWTADDPHAWRFLVDMRDFNPGRGFGIFAKADDNQPGMYRWAGMIGNGGTGGAGFTTAASQVPITLGTAETVYLALTYDAASQTLRLYMNGQQQVMASSVAYAPNTAQPLWIGAGAPFVARRPTQPADEPGSPLFPFKGAIQDVAIYNAALEPDVILLHYHNGNGTDP
jgi:hypothetical protein